MNFSGNLNGAVRTNYPISNTTTNQQKPHLTSDMIQTDHYHHQANQ